MKRDTRNLIVIAVALAAAGAVYAATRGCRYFYTRLTFGFEPAEEIEAGRTKQGAIAVFRDADQPIGVWMLVEECGKEQNVVATRTTNGPLLAPATGKYAGQLPE